MDLSPTLITFAIALTGSVLLTVPVRRLALHIGMVDLPGPRKVHLNPIPLLGGIAIYLGFVISILLTMRAAPLAQIGGILAGATLLAAVGLLDDGKLLHHQVKLFIGMPIAAVILIVSGVRAQIFSAFVPGVAGAGLDIALTLVWVVGITASFSILDHMDGLCAGIAAVAAAFFTLSATLNGQTMVRTLAAAALGAAVGFLIWNFNPAKIFMGDGGAMFLGFLMATLGLKIRPEGPAHFPAAWLVPVLILGATIFDTTLVSISRSRRGFLPFATPGKDHTAHRLSNLGLGHRGAVIAMYGLGAALGGVAIVVTHLPPATAYVLAGALAAAGLIAIALLERAPYERQVKNAKQPLPANQATN
jgi:UDP-GlcNAc:undecaprenyl-phosphate/decaprenyl-phosphate GlcNAc-1-phosphate transferase